MAGVFLRTYLVHSTYVFFCTRATISVFIVKPTVLCTYVEAHIILDRPPPPTAHSTPNNNCSRHDLTRVLT